MAEPSRFSKFSAARLRDEYMNSPEAQQAAQAGQRKLEARYLAGQQARVKGDLKNSNFGQSLVGGLNALGGKLTTRGFGATVAQTDADGNPILDDEGNYVGDKNTLDGASKEFSGQFFQNLGDAGGAALRGMLEGDAAKAAAAQAGALADAQNATARDAIMKGAGAAADSLNTQFAGQGMQLQDAAIGQANAFDAGMQGIGMSGIEGSGNMERNLQYGQDRADAQEQLAFDIMGQQGAALQSDMVNSFDQLSQDKAGAMNSAFAGSLDSARNNYLNTQYAAQAEEMANKVSGDDVAAVQIAGLDAAEKNGIAADAAAAATPAAAAVDQSARLKALIAARDGIKGGAGMAWTTAHHDRDATVDGKVMKGKAIQDEINDLIARGGVR